MTVGSFEAFSIRYCTACFASLSQTSLLLALLSLGTICLLYYLSRPLNLISDLTGANGDKYFRLPAKSDAMAKEHLKGRLQRKSGKSIPIYPNGWFGVLESSEIGRNEIKYVMALGKYVAVFRMSDGTVQVFNTCCSHLRVIMGSEGTAKTLIKCPSHEWQFDGETKKWSNIQGAKKVPDLAEVQTLRSVEVNQIIFLWYHAEGEEPSYEIQPLKEITSEGYTYVGRFEYLTDAHIEVGPGYVEFTTVFAKAKVYMTVCITPTGPLTARITGRLYGRPFHIFIGRFLLSGFSKSFEQDVAIWNYGKPRLHQNVVKEEGSLINFRRWYSQFYSKNSLSLDCEQRDICE